MIIGSLQTRKGRQKQVEILREFQLLEGQRSGKWSLTSQDGTTLSNVEFFSGTRIGKVHRQGEAHTQSTSNHAFRKQITQHPKWVADRPDIFCLAWNLRETVKEIFPRFPIRKIFIFCASRRSKSGREEVSDVVVLATLDKGRYVKQSFCFFDQPNSTGRVRHNVTFYFNSEDESGNGCFQNQHPKTTYNKSIDAIRSKLPENIRAALLKMELLAVSQQKKKGDHPQNPSSTNGHRRQPAQQPLQLTRL